MDIIGSRLCPSLWLRFYLFALGLLIGLPNAHAVVIDLNGITDAANSPQSIALAAGTYNVTPITGLYTALSLHSGAASSWIHAYVYNTPELGEVYVGRPFGSCAVVGTCFDTPAEAFLAQAEATTFTITSAAVVDFYICDGSDCFNTAGDNVAGISLELTTVSLAAESWSGHEVNPIFPGNVTGAWNDPFFGGYVLYDSTESVNKFKMWYIGGEVPGAEGEGIGYATSSDGLSWTDHPSNPIFTHGNTWDEDGWASLFVLKDGSTYKMWYSGVDISGVERIGYATSPDGLSWTPYASNPVFSPGVAGAWDEADVGNPNIIKKAGTYKMWYGADDFTTGTGQIGHATSTDGITWSRVGVDGLVFTPDNALSWQNGEGIGAPVVTSSGSGYSMAYFGADASGITQVGLAASSDGILWARDSAPIITNGGAGSWNEFGVFPTSRANVDGCEYIWVVGFDDSAASMGAFSQCFGEMNVPIPMPYMYLLWIILMVAGFARKAKRAL